MSFRQRNSTKSLTLSSLYVDSNSIAWISMYSGSDYSEFVKYDYSLNKFTIYQQQGIKYFLQYANSQDQWYGLIDNETTVHYAQLSSMNSLQNLSVTVSESGFIEEPTIFDKLSNLGASTYQNDTSVNSYNATTNITYTVNYTRTDKLVGRVIFSKRTMTNILAGLFIFVIILAIAKKVSKLIKKKCSRKHELVNENEVEHENLNVNDEDRKSSSNSDENYSGSNGHSDDSNQNDEDSKSDEDSKNNDDSQDEEDQV